jgi:hypothetical protein
MSARAVDRVRDNLMWMTPEQILTKYGCDREEIAKWLNGERSNPIVARPR